MGSSLHCVGSAVRPGSPPASHLEDLASARPPPHRGTESARGLVRHGVLDFTIRRNIRNARDRLQPSRQTAAGWDRNWRSSGNVPAMSSATWPRCSAIATSTTRTSRSEPGVASGSTWQPRPVEPRYSTRGSSARCRPLATNSHRDQLLVHFERFEVRPRQARRGGASNRAQSSTAARHRRSHLGSCPPGE